MSELRERDYKTTALIGDKAQGKSTLLAEIAKHFIDVRMKHYNRGVIDIKPRVLIHDPSSAYSFAQFPTISTEELKYGTKFFTKQSEWEYRYWDTGIRRIHHEDDKYLMNTISEVFRNGLVILDETSTWMPRESPKKWQKDLIIKHRNFGLDVIMVFHNFMNIPRLLRPHIWEYIIFKTPEKPDGPRWFEQRGFPHPEQIYRAWEEAELAEYDMRKGVYVQKYGIFRKTFESQLSAPRVFKNK